MTTSTSATTLNTKPAKLAQSLKKFQETNKDQGTRGNKFSLNPACIVVRTGFNARNTNVETMNPIERADFESYIDGLAIAYKNGDYVPPIVVKMVDGQPTASDGHCRMLGVDRAINFYGADIKTIDVSEFKGDDADEVALIATSNNNRKLKPLELSSVYVRLSAYGLSDADIAQKMGKTVPHVTQVKFFSELPVALKKMVNLDQIAVATAVELFENHGSKAFEIAMGLLNQVAVSGKKKVKVTSGATSPKMSVKERKVLNTTASDLHEVIKDVKVLDGQTKVAVYMTPELLAQLQVITAKASEIENFDATAVLEQKDDSVATAA
jgi:ParB family chromosome partitioning protein